MGEALNKYFTRHFLSIERQKKRYYFIKEVLLPFHYSLYIFYLSIFLVAFVSFYPFTFFTLSPLNDVCVFCLFTFSSFHFSKN